jgi:lactate dehydrogenase-like 2-hydroxyacid dehydrogenase
MDIQDLINLARDSEYVGLDPDNFGGFEKARSRVTQVLETLPNVKGVTLATTSFGWVDLEYCKKRNITVCNVPGYSRESVAEHTIALLLCAAKRILVTDRRTQRNAYAMEMGFELKGKTLGIIGLGNIGSRTAEIALGIGMNVVAYNHSPKTMLSVEMKSLDEVVRVADALVLHTTHTDANRGFINTDVLSKMKKGVIVINTADVEVVDENAMKEALLSGIVDTYICEGSLFDSSPLKGIEHAIGLKGFGYYTKEAIHNLFEIFVQNIVSLAKNSPVHQVGI